MENKILAFAKKCGYDGIEKTEVNYRGYEVYYPTFDGEGVAFTGYPYAILVKGEEIRMSTVDESLEILNIIHPSTDSDDFND